ncbi:TPA: hypothetical protein JG871_004242 [Enterobacter hormaechei subsp. xiangfangensis]|nr:hypothetical protein [Enterobacter hormaechei subsp. xiangfangensis]
MKIKGDMFKEGVLFTGYFMLMKCSRENCDTFGLIKSGKSGFVLSHEFICVMTALAPYALRNHSGISQTGLLWKQQQSMMNCIEDNFIIPIEGYSYVLSLRAINQFRAQLLGMTPAEIEVYKDAIKKLCFMHDSAKEELQNDVA